MINFIKIEFGRIGAETNITPREVIRDFIELLNIVCQNPHIDVSELLKSGKFEYSKTEINDEVLEKEYEEFEI